MRPRKTISSSLTDVAVRPIITWRIPEEEKYGGSVVVVSSVAMMVDLIRSSVCSLDSLRYKDLVHIPVCLLVKFNESDEQENPNVYTLSQAKKQRMQGNFGDAPEHKTCSVLY